MFSTAFLGSVLVEKMKKTILQSIASYDVIIVPKRVKFFQVSESGAGDPLS